MQNELFEEFKDSGAGKRPSGKPVLPDKAFTFVMTYEKLILAALASIILLTLTFVLGVEQGKKSLPARRLAAKTAKPYTIQVASYKSKEYALQEAEKLRKKGFSITLIGVNGKYEIWAGEYADQKGALQALNTLNKMYKNCYIRKR